MLKARHKIKTTASDDGFVDFKAALQFGRGDETVCAAWVRDPYMQYFCEEAHFQHSLPCDPSDLVYFRKRIDEDGMQKIFSYSVQMHGKAAESRVVVSDTTVQENNVSYPTDAKLAKKVIDRCNAIAQKECLQQRQSYVRVSKQLLREAYNPHHPKRAKKARKAIRKLRVIEGFTGNPHDSKTTEPLLAQMKQDLGLQPEEVVYDRGGRGKAKLKISEDHQVHISTPAKPLKTDSSYQRTKKRKKFRRRAAIEPVIGHLKKQCRMEQNYLHGENSPKINALLAAIAWNMKKMMEKLKEEAKKWLLPLRLFQTFSYSSGVTN